MAIITPAQSLCLGRPPVEPTAKTALELCAQVAAVIDWDRHRRNPPVAQSARQTYDKRKHRGITQVLGVMNSHSIH